MSSRSTADAPMQERFRHEALLYAGIDGFVDGEAGPRVRLKARSDDTGTFRVTRQAAGETPAILLKVRLNAASEA